MSTKFEEISNLWLENESYSKNYTYSKELRSSVKHLNRYFGDKVAQSIKGLDVEQYIRYCYETKNPNNGKPYSKRLLNDIVSTGYRIFEFALDNELIDNIRNPFAGKKKKIPKDAPITQRLPINNIQKQYILSVYHRAQPAALIMLFCGLRKGEIIALQWQDIDFNNKIIAVTKSAVRIDGNNFKITPHTKNGKDRYIPIPDNLISYLRLEKYSSLSKYIYPQKNGEMHTVTTWNKTWNSYQAQLNYTYYCNMSREKNQRIFSINSPLGIPKLLERFTAHQLRHTYCTMLYMAGVDILTASKLMGHSNIQITLEIYTHLDERYKKLNISKFNEFINSDATNSISLYNSLTQII